MVNEEIQYSILMRCYEINIQDVVAGWRDITRDEMHMDIEDDIWEMAVTKLSLRGFVEITPIIGDGGIPSVIRITESGAEYVQQNLLDD